MAGCSPLARDGAGVQRSDALVLPKQEADLAAACAGGVQAVEQGLGLGLASRCPRVPPSRSQAAPHRGPHERATAGELRTCGLPGGGSRGRGGGVMQAGGMPGRARGCSPTPMSPAGTSVAEPMWRYSSVYGGRWEG